MWYIFRGGIPMKRYILPLSFLMIVVIPNLLFALLPEYNTEMPIPQEATEPKAAQMLLIDHGGEIQEIELDDYVLCVLLGEMPASFEFEALKAQAVATRTYTLRHSLDYNKHANAHLCTDATCCQAYISAQGYLNLGHSNEDLQRMKEAVKQTANQVLTFDGDLIEATYFSCSGGRTENAADVWGKSVPYLVSVVSPGEENAKTYQATKHLSSLEFAEQLGLGGDLSLHKKDIAITYTSGGGVKELTVLNKKFTGTQLRTLLDLPSTVMELEVSNNTVTITTKGYGHRVGMSQYGADAMASSGKDYTQILHHYYRGTSLEELTQEQCNAIFDKGDNL